MFSVKIQINSFILERGDLSGEGNTNHHMRHDSHNTFFYFLNDRNIPHLVTKRVLIGSLAVSHGQDVTSKTIASPSSSSSASSSSSSSSSISGLTSSFHLQS